MTAILTLLFVQNPGEIYSPFLAPLRAAAPRLLMEHRTVDIKVLLSREPVDAILLDQDHMQDGIVAELKRIAPRTPVILLRHPNQQAATKPPGVAAVCCVDPRDGKLVHAMPIFFGFILGKLVLNFRSHTRASAPAKFDQFATSPVYCQPADEKRRNHVGSSARADER